MQRGTLIDISAPNKEALKNLLIQNTKANPDVVIKAWYDWINPSYHDEDIKPIYKIHADILKKPNLSFPYMMLYWKEY